MKHTLIRCMVLPAMLTAALPVFATTKTVTWSLPEGWAEDVSYPVVEGYRAIVGAELVPCSPMNAVGDPDLPFLRVNIDLPEGGTFVGIVATAEWAPVDLGGMWPLPIVQPVPTGSDPTVPAPSAAYGGIWPKEIAVAQPLQKLNRAKIVPVNVTPFRWDGATKTLYRATSLRVEAKFTNLDLTTRTQTLKLSNPQPSTLNPPPYFGDDRTADYVIISPPAFLELWKKYAEFRKTTENGKGHVFAVKSTAAIYEEYRDVGGDDAFKIHRYVEGLYENGNIKYILLGSAPKKYEYDPQYIVPSRYIVVGSSLGQVSDEYYGCMDRNPLDASGNEQGVEVWDYDGDGAYMGHKNANGSYSCDSPDKIDWTQEIVVFRFPLMREVVETRGNERIVLTAAQIMDNFIAKTKRIEGVEHDFPGRYGASLSGSTGFATSTLSNPSRPELKTAVVDERNFFDGGKNMFDPAHNQWSSDSEIVPRDRSWEFLTYLRGNDDGNVVLHNSSECKNPRSDMYDHSGDVFNILAHGWARGCDPGSCTEAFFSTGCYAIYCCPIPCDSGMMDYCPSGSYGITNCICFGEAPVLAPYGGSLASFNNTRLGWSATFAMSGNNGNGGHSHRMDWLLFRALSGVHNRLNTGSTKGDGTGEPMDAGHALMFAKNNFNAGYYASAAWGLSGLEVTGQGDPLARFAPQFPRAWRPDAANGNWNGTDRNWTIPGKNDTYAADYSTDVFADLTGKGDFTFNIQTNLSSAGFFVKQDVGATLTIAGDAKYRVTRETVVTNGNLRWEAEGGAGRFGVKFVGSTRGNIELPGDRPRYFGEKFANVGSVRVTGGNVTIDTPRDAQYGSGKAVDFASLAFVGEGGGATNNIFRTRKASFLPAGFTIPVVDSELILQVTDNPKIAATNATVTVRANPLYENCCFAREIRLHDATLVGDYVKFALGAQSGSGFDLYVSGKCAIAGTVPIKLNGDLRVHFEDADAELTIANPLADGTVKGSVTFIGSGKVRITGAQTFAEKLTVPDGMEVVCEVADAIASSVEVASGGDLTLAKIPLTGLADLTVRSGGRLHLPEPTYIGTYKIVDATTTTLDIQEGAKVYNASGEEISGEQAQGHYVLAANQLVWKTAGGTWDLDPANKAWETAEGNPSAYADNSPLKFDDLGDGDVSVLVGTNVAPGFVDFRNVVGRYFFTAADGVSPTITFNSLVATSPVTFDVPLDVPGGIMATGGSVQFGTVTTPKIEIAGGGFVRVTGRVDIPSQKVKKLKFLFSATRGNGERAAIRELRLFNEKGFFRLPNNTVIRDIAGQEITITGPNGTYGHTMTGSVGNESLSALVDDINEGGNKWWASRSASPTWFEIMFPEPQDPITAYAVCTADQMARDPKDWTVYAADSDDGRYSLVATEAGRTWNQRRSWMKCGDPQTDRFPAGTMSGLALVRTGGRLVLDGTWCADLDLGTDAVLVVTNTCALVADNDCNRLLLPDSGMVKIDLSAADSEATAFPILRGYHITAEQFGKFECTRADAMLLLQDGDIYAATANVMVPPYTANVTGDMNWRDVSFSASDGTSFKWGEANVKADGGVTLNVTGDATLTVDAVGTVASLTVSGSGKLTVVAADGITPLAPADLDDSGHTGMLVWNLPIGSAAVKAGKDTTIGGGAPGTGKLTVGAGMKATLGAGVTFANRDIDPAGWVRFEGIRENFVLADWPAATYSFENGTLAGKFTIDGHTIKSAAGDYVKLVGTNDNYFARSLFNFDISGGTVEIASNGETTWFGRTGTTGGKPATKFKMTGGTFRCLANGTSTGGGLLVGYEGGDETGNEIVLDISGGTLEVPESFFNFGTPTIVNLTGAGRIRAKGYTSSIASGVISLGTNVLDNACSLEVGSLGFGAGAVSQITMRDNAAIVGYENGATFSGSVVMYAAKWQTENPRFYIGAMNGATLALANVAWSRYASEDGRAWNGKEAMVFGNAAKGLTGEVVFRDAGSMPDKWTLGGGAANLGANRASAASVLTARPNGKVITEISYGEYSSGSAIEVLNTGGWSDSLAADDLRGLFTIMAEDVAGNYVEVADGAVKSLGGIVNFLPEGATGYVFPISAKVTGNANWSALDWRDRNGIVYTNDWLGVTSVELVNESGEHAVTMDRDVAVARLATRVTSGKTLTLTTSGAKTLTVTGKLDDSASAGTTVLDIALGEGVTIAAGKALQITGAANRLVPHGTLTIGAGSVATIRNGYWNGAVVMADSTSRLLYKSENILDAVPNAQGPATVGYVEYYSPMDTADGDALFGSADAKSADGLFYFRAGATLNTERFVTGKGNGTVQTLFQDKNASIVVTGDQGADSDNPSLVIGNDLGSATTYYVLGGTFISDNAPLVLGAKGTANFMFYRSGTCYRLKGVTTNGRDNNSSFTLSGTLELGSDGIDIVSSIRSKNPKFYPFNWSGTIVAKTDTTIRVPGAIGINGSGTFVPTNGAVMTVASPLVTAYMYYCDSLVVKGDGTVVLEEPVQLAALENASPVYLYAGALRLTKRGLLNASPVNFNGGKMQVLITRDEATAVGAQYKLFKTSGTVATVKENTSVLAAETMSLVDGKFAVGSDGTVTFSPTAITNIRATSDSFTGNWEDLAWKNAKDETVDRSVWNSTLGTATLTGIGASSLTFGGNCAATEIKIVNSGDLAVGGSGTMTVTTLDDSASTGTTRLGSCFELTDTKAGANTVFDTAGSGTLTIGQGKRATIPGWSNIANVSGAGTVSIDMGEKGAAVVWGANQTSGVSGTNEVLCGTWTHTTTATYPRNREVAIRGTNAVLRFATATDISGYDGYTQGLAIADGATWLVDMRDTFTRPLHLINGGRMRFKADNTNSGRAFDFYAKNGKSAKLTVSGVDPCVIGGQGSDVASVSGSGIVSLRLDNFTVDVKKESTLEVYSQWGYGKESAGNAWIKSGEGTMNMYRAAGMTGKLTINDGRLRLIDAGTATSGAIENNGVLEVFTSDGYRKGFPNALTGTGTFVKSGAGTLDFGTMRPDWPIDVQGGRMSFALTAAEKSANDWIRLYDVADGSACDPGHAIVYDVDGSTPANIVGRKVEGGSVYVRVEVYRMPITLVATMAQTKDWVKADWEDANGVHVESDAWEDLLAKTNLVLSITAHQDLVLNVNTNVTATCLTISGAGAVAFNSVDGHVLAAPVSGEGTVLVTGCKPALLAISEGEIPAGLKVRIASGSTFTNDALTVNGRVEVTYDANVRPFDGNVTFAEGSALAIAVAGYASSVPFTTGVLEMDPATVVYINGELRPAGTWKVSDDKTAIELPVAYPLAATLTGGGEWTTLDWRDANGITVVPAFWGTASNDCNVVIASDAAVTLTLSSALSIGTVAVKGTGAVTLPANLVPAKLVGSGTVVVNNAWPNYAGLTDAENWQGTVKLTGTIAAKDQTFADYGNVNSKIEIAGSIGGHLQKAGSCDSKIVVNGTLTFSNGYSSGGGYAFNGALSGCGTIATANGQTDVIKFLGDVDGFAGTIKVGGGHCVAFGELPDTAATEGKFVLVAGKTLKWRPGLFVSAAQGVLIQDGAKVEFDGTELARCAVAGVPYRAYFSDSACSGTIAVSSVPKGYALAEEKTAGYTAVVTAPEKAKFGVVSMNLHNGTALSGEGDHGIYPDVLANWGNLRVANNASATLLGSKFTLSSSVSGYGLDNNPPDMIYKQYMDDNASTRTIAITGISYDQYRLIVYYSTDTANANFRPLNVNGDWYAGSLASQNVTNYTVRGRNAVWGHSGPNHNANAPAEGVNALVTDVYSGNVTLSFTRNGGAGARATPCAIQIVKVGEIYTETVVVDPSQTGGVIPAESTNDVKIVCTWTNDVGEAAKLDLTPAYALEKVEGGVKATLNPAGSVVVGEETIQVKPELTDADDPQEPLVVGEDVAVGVKSIPGLTYELMRGAKPGEYAEDPIARERAKGPRTQLVDGDKPPVKAFYIIRVGK